MSPLPLDPHLFFRDQDVLAETEAVGLLQQSIHSIAGFHFSCPDLATGPELEISGGEFFGKPRPAAAGDVDEMAEAEFLEQGGVGFEFECEKKLGLTFGVLSG